MLNKEKRKKTLIKNKAIFFFSFSYKRRERKARRKNIVDKISVLPDIQATDSVFIGCNAKSIAEKKDIHIFIIEYATADLNINSIEASFLSEKDKKNLKNQYILQVKSFLKKLKTT
ncbi:MAG: hypothetical protein QXO70_04620 [Candidatus Pacearchaeota archaeon]